ncbi:hypothetical protein GQ53DRAFT_805884 [Thozetella sp. PMI_491]|nr:hypothetical protein GQ53DRAFT_805884 [Thozetella sp. PMI_491]
MVAIDALGAAVPGLMMVTAKISNPVLTPAVFNNWYSNIHVRDMVNNKFASLALRYTNYSIGQTVPIESTISLASHYLALYNVPDIHFLQVPGAMDHLPLAHESLPDKTRPVTTWSDWVFTYWLPLQTFEGTSNATAQPTYILVEKIEPAQGKDDDLDKWYRTEYLDKLSKLPGYRRTTRWKSSDGSKPRFLALHETDSVNTDSFASSALMSSDWAKQVISGAKVYDHDSYGLIFEKGNLQEKIGKTGS